MSCMYDHPAAGAQDVVPRQLPHAPSPRRTSRPLPQIPEALSCRQCKTCITSSRVLLPPSSFPPDSRKFRGFSGKASLFMETYNVTLSRPGVQLMSTGAHTMQEITCSSCSLYLGWKIVRAHEWSEKWKEGNCLLELSNLIPRSETSVGSPRRLRGSVSSDSGSSESDCAF